MGHCTYLAFCLSPNAESKLQKTLPGVLAQFDDDDSACLSKLISAPCRLVIKDGWLLRIWPAEKWYAGERSFVDFIEDFVNENDDEALLVTHGESYADGHDQLGVGNGNPFQITVDYPVGNDDPFFSYDDGSGHRQNTRNIIGEQLSQLNNEEQADGNTAIQRPE